MSRLPHMRGGEYASRTSGQIEVGPRSQPSIFLTSAHGASSPASRDDRCDIKPDPLSHPAIKFCGLSHEGDIAAVNEIMPEYVGLVFWPKSKRLVSAERAAALREALDPAIETVGVFVDAPVEEVAELVESGIISVVQLHGSEDAAYISELRRCAPEAEIWKAFEVHSAEDITRANASTADLVLLDGGKGEGNVFPWELLDQLERPFALAGGLTPNSVKDAIERCNPRIVDVSSGIEKPPSGEVGGNSPRAGCAANENDQKTFSPSEPLLEHGGSPLASPHKDPTAMRDFASAVRRKRQDDRHAEKGRFHAE